MQQLLYFLLTYKNFILLAMFGILSVTAFANFVRNAYGKQNTQLKKFNKKIVMCPSGVATETHLLPNEYQRQWRAYVNSGCDKPSTVFEFVKLPTPYLLWFAHCVATAISVFYLVTAILLNYWSLFATQIVFLLLSVIVLLVKNIIDKINLTHARKIFGKFLHDLNTVTQLYKNTNGQRQDNHFENRTPSQQPTFSTMGQLQTTLQPSRQAEGQNFSSAEGTQIQPSPKTQAQTPPSDQITFNQPLPTEPRDETIVDKAVRILRQKGLNNPRTAEEQRKLNLALNNLLQACCKRN